MECKKVNLVYFSPTQTTQKTLRAIAEGLGCEAAEFEYVPKLGEPSLPTFGAGDLVLVGVPVYGGRIPMAADHFYKSLKAEGATAVAVAVYGNRHYDDALVELQDILTEEGFEVVAGAACVAEHSFGPELAGGRPDADDLAKAKAFGAQLREKLAGTPAKVELPGNRPYKERGAGPAPVWAPETTDACIECGICVKGCPVGIIDAEDPRKITAPEKCLHCGYCVKNCPTKAKYFDAEPFKKSMAFLTANFTARREPEFYL